MRAYSENTRFRLRAGATILIGLTLATLLICLPADERDTKEVGLTEQTRGPDAPDRALAVSAPEAADLPVGVGADWWSEVSTRLAASEYKISESALGLQAPNRAENLRSIFRDTGIEIRPRDTRLADWHWSWSLEGWGREGGLQPVVGTEPVYDARRVEYLRDGITEWYENTEAGLEQGFTIPAPPSGDGPLCIEGALAGNLRPEWHDDDDAIVFLDENDAMVLRYSKLMAWDATGRELAGAMDLVDGGIRLWIDDREALYPVTVDPLMDTPDWHMDGYQEHTPFGISVATAGDVNGDGYSDVIASAPRYASGGSGRGRAWLYLGGPGGLETNWDWYGYGEQDYAIYGTSVASAGDVNGDGYDDLVVGQPSYDGDFADGGRAYVYYGSPTGLPWEADRILDGYETGQFFGWSVGTAGDVNGDGYADVIIGTDGDFAYVFHGSAGGLEATWSWRHQSEGRFGLCVATAGDVDGDGYDDVIVGAPADNSGGLYGRAFVFLGSAAGVLDDPDWETGETDYAHYGDWVATAGDVTGDGYSDVLVGAHIYSGDISLEGRAYLYEGSASGLSTTPSWTDEGGQNNSDYGWCVATAGDINADGYSDVLVTAKEYTNDQEKEGRVYLYMGHYDGLSTDPVWFTEGDMDSVWCGWSAASAGGVNGDGFGDIIVGIPDFVVGGDEIGRVVAFYGGLAGPRTQAGWVTESNQTDARYGASLAGVGDVNGDGYSDVLVGAPGYDYGQVDEGAVFLFLGSHQGLSWVFSWYAEGNQAGAALGVSVAGAGDVNGDGYPDGIVGAPGYRNTIDDEGAAFIWYSGSPYGNPANASWSAFGGQGDSDFGFSVNGGGDFNGDGYADVIVGAPYYDAGQTNEGAVFVYLGSETGPSPTRDWFHGADFANAEYGLSVAGAGDFNGDGYSDVLVGAPKYYVGETWEGYAFIYLGSADGPRPGAPWWNCKSNQTGARLGNSVAWAGDVNGDGYSDILVGAPRWDSSFDDSGIALLWLGQETAPPLGEPNNADWRTVRGQTGAWWGYAVGSAGDVNGDGHSDILIGSPYHDNAAGTNTGLAALWFGSQSGIAIGARWLGEGQQEDCYFSWCLASAGDVNGDGFCDIMVGARLHDEGQTNEGRAYVYYGNDSRGLSRTPEQWRSDLSAPIATLGASDSETAFALTARGRTPAGRGRVRIEYEIKRYDIPFDGTGTVLGSWVDTGPPSGAPGSFVRLTELVTGLSPGTLYHWRLRFLTGNPLFPRSPWLTLPDNGAGEADLRTAGQPSVGIAEREAPVAAPGLSAYPNPFNPQTRIVYVLPVTTHVCLCVYDVQGRLLRTLIDDVQEAGRHTVAWDGRHESGQALASGVYFAQLHLGERTLRHKLILAK
jgi:hypothetical protein